MAQSHPRDDIKVELKRLGLTQAWLARRAGVNPVNLSRWLDGTDPHDVRVWDDLLAAFPEAPIVGEPKIPVGFQVVKIPHAGIVPAGDWGDPLESVDFIEVDAKFESKGRFAATAIGTSCWPAIQPRDELIWQADRHPSIGVIVLAQRRSGSFCTVKQLDYDPKSQQERLMPINPDHEEATDESGWDVIARLVGLIRHVDGMEMTYFLPSGLRKRHLI